MGGLLLPHLEALGFGCITPMKGVACLHEAAGVHGKCRPLSPGKDSVSGHWELMGIRLDAPFPTYPNGFPKKIVRQFEERTGSRILGNKAASGTVIIQELGAEHLSTGRPIVYTSADSVFQIAAHEEVITPEELYALCESAREILLPPHNVGRVIARPFVGSAESGFQRTERRRDFPVQPPGHTVLDLLIEADREVWTVGKIDDLFGHRGISRTHHTTNNASSTQALLECLEKSFSGLLFINLIEFDTIYGHRNDPRGYADALEAFDRAVPEIQARLSPDDLVIVSADHGVDPTTPGTDHSREYVPLLAFGPRLSHAVDLGIRPTLSDVGATIAENFSVPIPSHARSFLNLLLNAS